ncbi:MAG: GyrI-like domain-containing protein [Anaerolineae bacterium]
MEKPQIVERSAMILLGMVFYDDPFKQVQGWSDQNEIGKLWGRFNRYWEGHRDLFQDVVDPDEGYEVHIGTEEYEETKEYYIMVGVEVSQLASTPPETFAKILPAGAYAVFTLKGAEIGSNWGDAIYKEWLPASSYEEAYPFTIERYDARFKGPDDPNSVLEILVPVRRKAT